MSQFIIVSELCVIRFLCYFLLLKNKTSTCKFTVSMKVPVKLQHISDWGQCFSSTAVESQDKCFQEILNQYAWINALIFTHVWQFNTINLLCNGGGNKQKAKQKVRVDDITAIHTWAHQNLHGNDEALPVSFWGWEQAAWWLWWRPCWVKKWTLV